MRVFLVIFLVSYALATHAVAGIPAGIFFRDCGYQLDRLYTITESKQSYWIYPLGKDGSSHIVTEGTLYASEAACSAVLNEMAKTVSVGTRRNYPVQIGDESEYSDSMGNGQRRHLMFRAGKTLYIFNCIGGVSLEDMARVGTALGALKSPLVP